MKLDVYNLAFRGRCREMTLHGYRFYRVEPYKERLLALHHPVQAASEFRIEINTGGHSHTAYVECPENQSPSVLDWREQHTTALSDVLLLLSLFTGRSVFASHPGNTEGRPPFILQDHRTCPWGGPLRTSVPYVRSRPEAEPQSKTHDIGLEYHLNEIYTRIREESWLSRYRNGHFLLLYRGAVQQRTVDSAFIHCWTIWEHLFSLLNESWMSEKIVRNFPSADKIAFILVEFALKERLHAKEKGRLEELANIRNRLIHHGMFPDGDSATRDAEMFIFMTDFVVAKILGLRPSAAFNTLEHFEEFLARPQQQQRKPAPPKKSQQN